MEPIQIDGRTIGPGRPVLIVAEAGINHDGKPELAHKLIDAAAEAGADCIKFQTHFAACEMLDVPAEGAHVKESLFQLVKRMEMTAAQHAELIDHARQRGLIFLSTPFCREAADLLEQVGVGAYKIGSGQLTSLAFLEYVAEKGKPMIVSTGMGDLAEVQTSVELVRSKGVPFALMQCTSQYPTAYENVRLGVIRRYVDLFDVPVGLSDHSQGNYVAFAAVALGACLIEKHFTVSRQWPGPDQASSIEPDELADLVRGVRAVELASGDEKAPVEAEQHVRPLFRESVVTVRPLSKGQTITRDCVWTKRPGSGIPAPRMSELIGRRAARNIEADTLLSWDDLV